MSTEQKPEPVEIKLDYKISSALFSNQFIVNTSKDDLILDFSSGAIKQKGSPESILPVHSRIAMTYAGAERLANLLLQACQKKQ